MRTLVTLALVLTPAIAGAAFIDVDHDVITGRASAEACFQPLNAAGDPVGAAYCVADRTENIGSAFLGGPSGIQAAVNAFGPSGLGSPVASARAVVLAGQSGVTLAAGGTAPGIPVVVPCAEGQCRVQSASAGAGLEWRLRFSVTGDDAAIYAEAFTRTGNVPISLVDLTTGSAVPPLFGALSSGHSYALSIAFGGNALMSTVPQGSNQTRGWVEFRNATVRVPDPGTASLLGLGLALMAGATRRTRRRADPHGEGP